MRQKPRLAGIRGKSGDSSLSVSSDTLGCKEAASGATILINYSPLQDKN